MCSFWLTCGCLINTYPYVPPSISAGWKWGGGTGEQGLREKKRGEIREGRGGCGKNEEHRGWEKRKEEKPSLEKGELDGASLVMPGVMKTLTLLHQSPVLGQDLTLF